MESLFGINKKYWRKNQGQEAHTLSTRVGARLPPWARPLPRGPPGAPPTSTPTLYIHVRGEKNQREGFIAFYDTESPPSPFGAPERGIRRRRHHQPSSITNFMMLTAVRE